jgi:hypothetical protein
MNNNESHHFAPDSLEIAKNHVINPPGFFFCASSCQTQVPLAALTARAHQLKEYMEKLEEQLSSSDILSQIPARTVLLVPPVPLSRPGTGDSANWPLCLG